MSNEIENISVELTETYYDNDHTIFFEYMDDDIVWIGPGIKQQLKGKKKVEEAFGKENNNLNFRLENLAVLTIYKSLNAIEILLTYLVYTYYPNGNVLIYHQRTTLLWHRIDIDGIKKWRYILMHISNGMETDERDFIYPIHLDEFEIEHRLLDSFTLQQRQANRLVIKGSNGQTNFVEFDSIFYILGGKGRSSEIVTKYKTINVNVMLSELEKKLPKEFYRYHRSYIINVLAITSIRNNSLTLINKVDLPVPQKKYSVIKKEIKRRLNDL